MKHCLRSKLWLLEMIFHHNVLSRSFKFSCGLSIFSSDLCRHFECCSGYWTSLKMTRYVIKLKPTPDDSDFSGCYILIVSEIIWWLKKILIRTTKYVLLGCLGNLSMHFGILVMWWKIKLNWWHNTSGA
jgi:hypothetical protein